MSQSRRQTRKQVQAKLRRSCPQTNEATSVENTRQTRGIRDRQGKRVKLTKKSLYLRPVLGPFHCRFLTCSSSFDSLRRFFVGHVWVAVAGQAFPPPFALMPVTELYEQVSWTLACPGLKDGRK